MMERRSRVYLHGLFAGDLIEAASGGTSFRLSKAYRDAVPRPVLSQSFEDDLHREYRGKPGELPAFFANLVPEGALRELLEETASVEPGDDFALLEALGSDLPGAVEVSKDQPSQERGDRAGPHVERPDDSDDLEATRFSLAGLQLKFSVLREADKITIPTKGRRGEWIAKLDSPRFPQVVENEFAMLQWARAAGFDVPECHLLPGAALKGIPRRYLPAQSKMLVIKRYDRSGGERIHQEDFAQVVRLPPRLKYDHITYEQLGTLVRAIVGVGGYDEFVRRLTFVIASGNADAHLKNWSLIYPDRVRARLSPVYDQVSTVAWSEVGKELALKLAGVKAFHAIDAAAIRRFATRSGDDPERVLDLVGQTLGKITAGWAASPARPPMLHIAELRKHWQNVPLLRESGVSL